MDSDPMSAQGSDPGDGLARARMAAEQGDYQTAAALYQRGVGNPDPQLHVAALLGLADARYRLDDEQGALQAWLTATVAPETPLAWRAWVALAGARVREGDLPGAARCYREAEARAPSEEKAAIQSRLGWLNKEMGNSGAASRYFGRARGTFTPLITYSIIAVTVAVSAFTMIGGAAGDALLNQLALIKPAVQDGEYWRLLTVALVHDTRTPLHLLMNMYALWIIGPLAEALYGRVAYLAMYMLAAIGGAIASYLVFPNPSVGASGAIFGLFGLVFASTHFHKTLLQARARAITSQIGVLIVINLVIGFGIGGFAGIDNSAHVGGLLVGAWLGLLIAPSGAATLSSLWQRNETNAEPRPTSGPLIRVLGVVALGAVLVGALLIKPFWA
ncbi:MAG TPA: rhomboid family intramembrane serine protease [Candidatus Limnocylindria bacterium]|nr:rhomboid family intramembrane serine protease [Candidatus Limnocylindria bacterium]